MVRQDRVRGRKAVRVQPNGFPQEALSGSLSGAGRTWSHREQPVPDSSSGHLPRYRCVKRQACRARSGSGMRSLAAPARTRRTSAAREARTDARARHHRAVQRWPPAPRPMAKTTPTLGRKSVRSARAIPVGTSRLLHRKDRDPPPTTMAEAPPPAWRRIPVRVRITVGREDRQPDGLT